MKAVAQAASDTGCTWREVVCRSPEFQGLIAARPELLDEASHVGRVPLIVDAMTQGR